MQETRSRGKRRVHAVACNDRYAKIVVDFLVYIPIMPGGPYNSTWEIR